MHKEKKRRQRKKLSQIKLYIKLYSNQLKRKL